MPYRGAKNAVERMTMLAWENERRGCREGAAAPCRRSGEEIRPPHLWGATIQGGGGTVAPLRNTQGGGGASVSVWGVKPRNSGRGSPGRRRGNRAGVPSAQGGGGASATGRNRTAGRRKRRFLARSAQGGGGAVVSVAGPAGPGIQGAVLRRRGRRRPRRPGARSSSG